MLGLYRVRWFSTFPSITWYAILLLILLLFLIIHFQTLLSLQFKSSVTLQFIRTLDWPLYFANIWNISLRALGFAMRHSSDFLLPLTIRLLYCSLLRLHVEYVYLIWSCYFVKRMLLPERIQHRFLRFASRRLHCALWAERTIIIPLPIMSLLDPRSVDEHRFVAGLSLLRKIIDDHANSWHILVSINSNAPLRPLRKPLLFLCHSYKLLIYILIL